MSYKIKLIGIGQYSQSKPVFTPKKNGENGEDYEARTWSERSHYNKKNQVFVPTFALQQMMASTAKRLNMKVPGDKRKTYSNAFLSGIIVPPPEPLLMIGGKPVTRKEVESTYNEWVFCNSDGVRGSGKRVLRKFPQFDDWSVEFELEVIDHTITETVLKTHLVAAGKINGLGRFRPQKGGTHGRFDVLLDGKKIVASVDLSEAEEE